MGPIIAVKDELFKTFRSACTALLPLSCLALPCLALPCLALPSLALPAKGGRWRTWYKLCLVCHLCKCLITSFGT